MIKKIFRYVITLVVMTIAVGLLYALYNHNIWGIQQYVADYAVILFGVFIGIIYFILCMGVLQPKLPVSLCFSLFFIFILKSFDLTLYKSFFPSG